MQEQNPERDGFEAKPESRGRLLDQDDLR